MDKHEIEKKLKEILTDECEVDTSKLSHKSSLSKDLELDSMSFLTLAVEIENHWKIKLGENPNSPPETIEDIINLISKRLSEK